LYAKNVLQKVSRRSNIGKYPNQQDSPLSAKLENILRIDQHFWSIQN